MFNLDTKVGLVQHGLLPVELLLMSHSYPTRPGTHARALLKVIPLALELAAW